jgi:hypothetical protein
MASTTTGSGYAGPVLNNNDYSLYMQDGTIIDEPLRLDNMMMSDVTNDNREPIEYEYTEYINGVNVPRKIQLRSAQKMGQTFTIGYGGSLENKLKAYARRNNPNCSKVLYLIANCPSDARYKHAYIETEVKLSPPQRTVAALTTEQGEAIMWESEAYSTEEILLWNSGNYVVTDLSEPAYGVAVRETNCVDCTDEVFQEFAVVATDGGSFNTYVTTDRFATTTDKTALGSAAPSDSVPTSIYYKDDIILVGFRNAAGLLGGTVISTDNGTSATIDSNLTVPAYAVGRFDGQYVAVGGALAGQAMFWYSDNGIAWTSVTSANLPANKALLSLAVDNDGQTIYAVGEDGLAVKIFKSAGAFNISAITLPGSVGTTDINVVRVLAKDHVAVGGAGGYYAESLDAGVVWTQPSVTTTSAIKALAGNVYNTVYGAATSIAKRNVLSDYRYAVDTFQNGASVSGDFVGADSITFGAIEDETNYYVLVTDEGEVVIGRPQTQY